MPHPSELSDPVVIWLEDTPKRIQSTIVVDDSDDDMIEVVVDSGPGAENVDQNIPTVSELKSPGPASFLSPGKEGGKRNLLTEKAIEADEIQQMCKILRGSPQGPDFTAVLLRVHFTESLRPDRLYAMTPALCDAASSLLANDHPRALLLVKLIDRLWERFPFASKRAAKKVEPLDMEELGQSVERLVSRSVASWPHFVRGDAAATMLRVFRAAERALQRKIVPREIEDFCAKACPVTRSLLPALEQVHI